MSPDQRHRRQSAGDYSRERYVARTGRRTQPTYQQRDVAVGPAYTLSGGNLAASSHRGKGRFAVLIILIAIACAAACLVFNPPFFTVTVNGNEVNANIMTTLQSLVDDGYANPNPGNLIAVDGTVAESAGGSPFSATVNGEPTDDPHGHVTKDAIITIDDGIDVEEPYTEVTATIPFEHTDSEASQSSYYQGPIHLYSAGKDGEQVVKRGSVSGKTVTSVTIPPINSGFVAARANVGDDKVVALTFDDGPWPSSTREILKILKANDAKATFFSIGEQVKDNAGVLKELHEAGNQIATHSYDHAAGAGQGVNLTYMPSDQQVSEITKGLSVIEEVLGTRVTPILRAPGGNYYGSIVETLSPYVDAEIGWDVDTKDWSRPGVDAIVAQLLSAKPGDIILCHDGGGERSQTVEAIRIALPQMVEQGYRFVTIDELMSYGLVPCLE